MLGDQSEVLFPMCLHVKHGCSSRPWDGCQAARPFAFLDTSHPIICIVTIFSAKVF